METEFPGDDFLGLQYIMSDDILNRIVDLAYHKKLSDIPSLLEQTDWQGTGRGNNRIGKYLCATATATTSIFSTAMFTAIIFTINSSRCLKYSPTGQGWYYSPV